MSEPMEDYEVKDVMFRHHSPSLVIIGASLDKQEKDDSYSFSLDVGFKIQEEK